MDIFGVGAAEILIVALLTLIVAGPKRSAEWARQAGVWLGQLREMWGRMMDDLRNEVGEDADEILKTADEFRRTATDFRQQTSVRNLAGRAMNLAETSTKKKEGAATANTTGSADDNGSNGIDDATRYGAWVKPSTEDLPTAPDTNSAE